MTGRVFRFGDHVDTDVIIGSTHIGRSEPEYLAAHCFAVTRPDFAASVRPGDVVVAGENFGCGSSREHAPIAIKGAGVAAVVAGSFARIFYRSAINIGLPVIVCPEAAAAAAEGDAAAVDLVAGEVRIGGRAYAFAPFPEEVRGLLACGGLVAFMRARLEREAACGR